MCRLCAFALQHQKTGRNNSTLLSTHQFSSLVIAKQLANQVVNKAASVPPTDTSPGKEVK